MLQLKAQFWGAMEPFGELMEVGHEGEALKVSVRSLVQVPSLFPGLMPHEELLPLMHLVLWHAVLLCPISLKL